MKKILYPTFILSIVLMLSCSTQGTVIEGTIENASELTYTFEQLGINQTSVTTLATQKTGQDGSFSIPLTEGIKPGIYRVRVGAKAIELVADGTEKDIEIKAQLETIQNGDYTISGAPLMEAYLKTLKEAMAGNVEAAELEARIKGDIDPLLGFMYASRMFPMKDDFAELHEHLVQKLEEKYPGLYFLEEYQNVTKHYLETKARKDALAKIKVGQEAPDITLPNPDGVTMSLSDFRGKVVLLDFWASWCKPCRKANPHVVEMYQKYKDQGFDVFSVSLDSKRDRWAAAIQQDNLTWEGHVSDLRHWQSQAAFTYGVSSIPKTFLIDRNGIIAAVNPRYNLEEELKKAL